MPRSATLLLCAILFVGVSSASAAHQIAVFGDNNVDNFINTLPGYSAVLVTDAQLQTPGFLASYDAFVFTRPGTATPGTGLSAAAAANVAAYVGATGNIVLLNGDFQDGLLGNATINQLFENSVSFAAGSGHGYLGEYTGAVAALTSNSDSFSPIGLISGAAGPLGPGNGGSGGSLLLTAQGLGHPVTSGIAFPFNPAAVEFGATMTGVNPLLVLATFDNGNPGIIARGGVDAVVPEPTSVLAWSSLGLLATLWATRRRVTKRG